MDAIHTTHDLLICAVETNDRHGVGILLQRLFAPAPNLITLRSATMYQGDERLGAAHLWLRSQHLREPEIEEQLKILLAPYRIARILCVPYFREDFIHGLLAQKVTGAPLCTYIMDDQNIFSPIVPDYRVDRLLRNSRIRFGISPELCAAYRYKFGYEMHLLPPVLEAAHALVPCYWQRDASEPLKLAMIGNIWTAKRFRQFRALVRSANLQVHWYGSGPEAAWLEGSPEEWEKDNILCMGFLPEDDLVASLASYPAILVPSGSLDDEDDNIAFTRLSLPSRLLFLHTRTDTPIIVLGSEDSAAGRFVRRLGTGLCTAYDAGALQRTLDRLLEAPTHQRLRLAVRQWSSKLILKNGGQWLWEALVRGSPLPATFHTAFAQSSSDSTWLHELPREKLPPAWPTPRPDRRLADSDLSSFGFLRTSHLPLLANLGSPPPAADEIELTHFLSLTICWLARQLLHPGAHVLIIDTAAPYWAGMLPTDVHVWRVRDFDAWLHASFPADPQTSFVGSGADSTLPPAQVQFDAIISANRLDPIKTPEQLERFGDFLARHTRSGGFNLHGFTSVLHPEYYWRPPPYTYLRTRWALADLSALDHILTCPDIYFMSEKTYARHWEPTLKKSYAEFGNLLGLNLFWRNLPQRPAAHHG